MLSVNLLMISRSRRISSSVGYCSFCGYWPCWNGEYEKPEICSGQLGALTGRLISAQKPVNSAAIASTTTRLSPNLRDDMAISGSKRCGTKRGVGLRRTARILHRPFTDRTASREKPDIGQRKFT